MQPTLELRDIEKSFPGVNVLKGVGLAAAPGRVHALLGENGAGKSTFIKIASGGLQPDAGEILIEGRPVSGVGSRLTPRAARAAGIRVLHQERQILWSRTVADNVLIDQPQRNGLRLATARAANAEAARRLSAVGVDLDPSAPAGSLTVAQMQLLELARAVNSEARCIILDEPTASLHRDETGALFSVVRHIRDAGIAVIYISHHLDEVMELADEYTVLRDGSVTDTGAVAETSPDRLIKAMFGTEVSLRREDVFGADAPSSASGSPTGEEAVALESVSLGRAVRDVSLTARRGEVVVVTGAVGCGSREVAQLLAGARRPTSGTVRIAAGRSRGRRHAARAGVGFLPANRKLEGLLLDRPVTENALLAESGIRRWLTPFMSSRANPKAEHACGDLAVKMSDSRAPIRGLSGGNQQKVIMARWLQVGSDVLILDEPTAGVDIPSKFEIYRLLRQRAAEGCAVIVFSTEYQEIRCVADRVLVMRSGRIVGEIDGDSATEHALFEIEMGA